MVWSIMLGNFISRTQDLSHRGFDAIASIVFHGTFYVAFSGQRWIELGMEKYYFNFGNMGLDWITFTVPSAMSKSGFMQ